MSCPAVHPETGERCALDGNHREHQIQFFDSTSGEIRWGKEWPNEDYVAKVVVSIPPASRTKTALRQLTKDIAAEAKRAEAERREELLDSMPKFLARADGPATSEKAARSVSVRSRSQKALLLVEYARVEGGLTDEEAADRAGLLAKPKACWWHRSSDLRKDELIVDTGAVRVSTRSGEENMVCVITDLGRRIAAQLKGD